jgi:hypothetical protein
MLVFAVLVTFLNAAEHVTLKPDCCSLPSAPQDSILIGISVLQIPVAARSKAWVCCRSLTGIVASNPTGDMDVCVL